MAISKERKDELVAQYKQMIEESRAIFLTSYVGMSVKEMEALRTKIMEANGSISVTKNTLLSVALQESDIEAGRELLEGQLATSFAFGEVPTLAKVLVDQAKANEKLAIAGGILGNKTLTASEIEDLAKLPSLDQLRAQIVGLIGSPAQGLASVVASGVRQVVNVVDAYARKEEGAAEAAA